MKLQDFLQHHRIRINPFAEEDAQTDAVFKDHCISNTYHPAWDKVFGSPTDPSTSIVFGEKGAGKTALRLQIERHVEEHNRQQPEARCLVIAYDDFNPFLDRFRERVGRRSSRAEKILQHFRLWDHMDAILSLAVTRLVTAILDVHGRHPDPGLSLPADTKRRMDKYQRRDLLLLATAYDNSLASPLHTRLAQLRRRVGFHSVSSWWPWLLGVLVTLLVVGGLITFFVLDQVSPETSRLWETYVRPFFWAYPAAIAAGWAPWLWRSARRFWLALGIRRHMRVVERHAWPLSRHLMHFDAMQLAGQPFPNKERTDDRYALLNKLQGILQSLGYKGLIVLVDRLDEPHLINGSTDSMRAFLWPMLDNKFLKQEGIGIKFLLPIELTQFIDREGRDFYQRARLDKQNMIPSLRWTGAALYDVANARLAACSEGNPPPTLADLLDESLTENRLFEAFQSLRVPRHMFKFLYRAIMTHCNQHSGQDPSYRISSETFESELALYRRDQEAAERGLGA